MTPTNQSSTSTNQNEISYGDDSDLLKKPDIAKLNGYYLDGDSADQEVFAEMRSNIMLVAGEHYNRRRSNFYRNIRDSKDLSSEQKLRLTKNHTRKICQLYANNIVSMDPGVGFTPKDENNPHDVKVTELHHSVWQDARERYHIDDKIDDWVDSFVQIGEVHVKLFYDPSLGDVAGYEPQIDPQTGSPSLNEFGQMVPDDGRPVFTGEFVFEEVYGFNLLRPPECKDLRKAEWLGIRKMVNKNDLKRRFKGNEEIEKFIQTDADDTYVVFDAIRGGYKKTNNQTMIREYYFRPSLLFPEGWYYITTKAGVLDEGPLPGGFFPIISQLFDKIQTTPRGRSPVKVMRPYQAEINRAGSKIAETQISLGDDKLIVQNGSKMSAGGQLPGIRAVNVTGAGPTILPGRSGDQYLAYMNSQIAELYQVMGVAEDSEEKQSQLDPFSLLYRSARQKKKFQRYIKKMEKFLLETVSLYLRLAKLHLPDDAIIYKIGKNEQVNMPEFKTLKDICYETKIEAQADDIETKLGKQLVLNHALQYVGPQMQPEDIGRIMKAMPYANFNKSFDRFMLNETTAENSILALDRGETPPVGEYDNHPYQIEALSMRMQKADYRYLAPNIQQNYVNKMQLHQEFEAQKTLAMQRAEQGFIPTGGYFVTCDFYVQDPSDQTGQKTRRARIPYQAMDWLIKQLEAQGQSQEQLASMNSGAQAQIMNMVEQMKNEQPAPGEMPQQMPMQGQQIA